MSHRQFQNILEVGIRLRRCSLLLGSATAERGCCAVFICEIKQTFSRQKRNGLPHLCVDKFAMALSRILDRKIYLN